jgi:hypothetical protein
MISVCSKITQGFRVYLMIGRGDASSINAKSGSFFGDSKQELAKQQDRRLHLRALCILTAIIQSLVKFTAEDDRAISKSGASENENSLDTQNPVVIGKNPLHSITMRQVCFFALIS